MADRLDTDGMRWVACLIIFHSVIPPRTGPSSETLTAPNMFLVKPNLRLPATSARTLTAPSPISSVSSSSTTLRICRAHASSARQRSGS